MRFPKPRSLLLGVVAGGSMACHGAVAFDHQHGQWDVLLSQHVEWVTPHNTRVDYQAFLQDEARLDAYLEELSAVAMEEFAGWAEAEQLAFLINAYNAFTVKLILTEYPELDSIKDLGSLFQSPWKIEFFQLLGENRHLDWIEHEKIRVDYQEPRIHVAINCAAIGCPALLDEAYTGGNLETRLEKNMEIFLSDQSRNRFNKATDELELSKIFDWFEEDFQQRWRGWNSVAAMAADYSTFLADDPAAQQRIREKAVAIDHLSYDWSLNSLSSFD